MQLNVCFVLASSLLTCLSYLYKRSSEKNYLLLVTKCPDNPQAFKLNDFTRKTQQPALLWNTFNNRTMITARFPF